MPTDPDRLSERMWASMARAIIGSGSYTLRGDDSGQIQVLAQWLRQCKDQGFDWKTVYQQIYNSWAQRRPLLPPSEEMERLVGSLIAPPPKYRCPKPLVWATVHAQLRDWYE